MVRPQRTSPRSRCGRSPAPRRQHTVCAATKAAPMGDVLRRRPIWEQGAMPYLWLVYAVRVPVSLIGVAAPRLVIFQLAVLAVFLVCYFLGYGTRGREALVYAAVLAGLGAIASPSDGFASTYFIYAATFLAWGLPAGGAYRVLAAYVPLVALVVWLTHVNVSSAIVAVVFSGIVGVACINFAEQRRAHVRLKQAYGENERLAKIAERERIARDLHDVLGHTLSLIAFKSQLASNLAPHDQQRDVKDIRALET